MLHFKKYDVIISIFLANKQKERSKLFSNPGEKIKGIAIFVFVVDLIAVIILAIWLGTLYGVYLGIAVVVIGLIISWIAVIGLFAYGCLVDNVQYTKEILERLEKDVKAIRRDAQY